MIKQCQTKIGNAKCSFGNYLRMVILAISKVLVRNGPPKRSWRWGRLFVIADQDGLNLMILQCKASTCIGHISYREDFLKKNTNRKQASVEM